MFGRTWERLRKYWAPKPCARCGKPSVGLYAEMSGRLHTKDADGKPITKMYVRDAEWRCRACIEGADK